MASTRSIRWCSSAARTALVITTLLAPPALAQEARSESNADNDTSGSRAAQIRVPTDDPRIQPETGADLAHLPPARHFDPLHLRLELDIPTMSKPALNARQYLTVRPVGRARRTLVLNAGANITIDSIRVANLAAGATFPYEPLDESQYAAATFTRDADRVTITLPGEVPLGRTVQLLILHRSEHPNADGNGLTWTQGTEDAESPTNRAAQIHSQGQPEFNRSWIVGHDFPNDRLTTELIVTVEDGYTVLSNGVLLGTTLASSTQEGRPRTRWHWRLSQPHPMYLVTLAIGKWSIIGLTPREGDPPMPRNARGEELSLPLYVPIGTEAAAQKNYAKTAPMLWFFADYFDEPYPWDARYAQVLVRSFFAGGMENTTATTMRAESATSRRSQDGIIAHEIAHQWLGNMITCRSWEHLWLNEGWASYSEALWAEHEALVAPDGSPEKARRAYLRKIAGFVGVQRGLNRTYAPLFPGIASPYYPDALSVFMKPNDVYSKGAVVLHMLRMKLGDTTFQAATRAYIDRFRFKEVETDDFRRVLEEVSGISLESFFDQWVRRPGIPRLEAALDWEAAPSPGPDEGTGQLKVTIKQTQRIDAANPPYEFQLPIEVVLPGGERRTLTLPIDSAEASAVFALEAKPTDVTFDPMLTVAAPTRITRDLKSAEPANP